MKIFRSGAPRLLGVLTLLLSGAAACGQAPPQPGAMGFVWLGDDHVYSVAQHQANESGQLLRTDRKLHTDKMRVPRGCWIDLNVGAIARVDDHRFAIVLSCGTPTLFVYDTASQQFEKRSGAIADRPLIAFEPTMTTGFQADACTVQRLRWDGHDYTSEPVDLGPVCVHGNGVSALVLVTVDGQQQLLHTAVSASDGDRSHYRILAHDMESGRTRVIRDDLVGRKRPVWAVASSDGGTLFATSTEGISRIDIRSGRVEQVRSGAYYRLSLSPDDRTLFVQRFDGDKAVYEFIPVTSAGS
ncbi:hypothetical protein [Dactylosporangium sp. NPDC051484]|uniref:hypothetical protein n=1 Tax=Dactylosporangium sp. NPDC051484 TaxID=3154942 RepID=UPI00344B8D5A